MCRAALIRPTIGLARPDQMGRAVPCLARWATGEARVDMADYFSCQVVFVSDQFHCASGWPI
jgi:hypothetical protein